MPDPLMPPEIISWLQSKTWGMHHVMWHAERTWDLIDPQERSWIEGMGGFRAARQEGETGNGLDFLAMHRAMLQILNTQFASKANLFTGWVTPPTDPSDPNDPVPASNPAKAFNPDMLEALDRLRNHVGDFAVDDDIGLYIQTRLRPQGGNPRAASSDPSAGLHNYFHNRFEDDQSPVNMGDPQLNLGNQRFWRLHGWIDARWSAMRTAKNLDDNDPLYKDAIAEATRHMSMAMEMKMGTAQALAERPARFRSFFRIVEPRG